MQHAERETHTHTRAAVMSSSDSDISVVATSITGCSPALFLSHCIITNVEEEKNVEEWVREEKKEDEKAAQSTRPHYWRRSLTCRSKNLL